LRNFTEYMRMDFRRFFVDSTKRSVSVNALSYAVIWTVVMNTVHSFSGTYRVTPIWVVESFCICYSLSIVTWIFVTNTGRRILAKEAKMRG